MLHVISLGAKLVAIGLSYYSIDSLLLAENNPKNVFHKDAIGKVAPLILYGIIVVRYIDQNRVFKTYFEGVPKPPYTLY